MAHYPEPFKASFHDAVYGTCVPPSPADVQTAVAAANSGGLDDAALQQVQGDGMMRERAEMLREERLWELPPMQGDEEGAGPNGQDWWGQGENGFMDMQVRIVLLHTAAMVLTLYTFV